MAWTNVLTKAGENLLASAFGATLNYTKVKAASGSVDVSLLADQTDVTNYIKDFSITGISVQGSTSVLNARLDNVGITAETQLTQVGIFANVNGGEEVLLIIYQTDTPSTIPPASVVPGYAFEPQYNITIANIASFTAVIDWNAYATVEQVQEMIAESGGGVVFSTTEPTGNWVMWLEDLGETDFPFDDDGTLTLLTAPYNTPGEFAVEYASGGAETVTNMTDNAQTAGDNDIVVS
jgi:hypothetical protein